MRQSNKSGSNDENSTWALARCAQCEQFLDMLELGKLPRDCPKVTESDIPPLRLHGVVFWDEHHKKCVIGGYGKYETRVYVDEEGAPTHPNEGGQLPDLVATVTTKFSAEARGCFGVAMVKQIDGNMHGARAVPFNYTGRVVIGIKSFQEQLRQEYNRVKQVGGCWGARGKGYQERYNEHWEERLLYSRYNVACSE